MIIIIQISTELNKDKKKVTKCLKKLIELGKNVLPKDKDLALDVKNVIIVKQKFV